MITLVLAHDSDLLIGNKNRLPWHIKEDLQRFKKITMGSNIVMGRKTFESLPRMLPGRHHIILTRDESFRFVPVSEDYEHIPEVFHSVDNLIQTYYDKDLYIIGGSEIYNQMITFADKIELTLVYGSHVGDVYLSKETQNYIYDNFNLVYQEIRDECEFLTFNRTR